MQESILLQEHSNVQAMMRMTGNWQLILTNDKKENAEHVMLVDLARNDLSRNSDNVAC